MLSIWHDTPNSTAISGWRFRQTEGKDTGTLFVTFHTGIYAYRNVPVAVAVDMITQVSVGRFVASVIKPNYVFHRLDESLLNA